MKIYSANVVDDCKNILPGEGVPSIVEMQFNEEPLLKNWCRYQYNMHDFGKGESKVPDIWVISGALAMRADLKDKIFPFKEAGIEFLPIQVGRQDWYIANCLITTDSYDGEQSVVYSGPEGKIFMIIHLVVTDNSLKNKEIFVLENSNRSTLLMLSPIVERISNLGLKGVSFQEIGYLKDDILSGG